jgi:uncharacterized repeat protein (TIGR03806 family)
LLSQTGAFADTPRLIPAPGLIPYVVNAPLWSDGAVKTRWMALPGEEKIAFAEKGEWAFPNGTVFVKHFELPVDEAHPDVRRRLETRLLVRDASGSAYGVAYKWRADNSDADLVTDAVTEDIAIHTASGATRTQSWYFPSQTDCIRCHTPAAGYVLGPKTRQLNGDMLYPATQVKDNQLRALNHVALFNPPIDETKVAGLEKLTPISDASAAVETRVRSYLDSNCSQCHRPGGVHALWDARFETPLSTAAILNGLSINKLGIAGARVVRPGDVDHSVLYRRMNALDPVAKMPPVARNTIDPVAVDAVRQWIAAMPPSGELPRPWIADDIGPVGQPGDTTFVNNAFAVTGSGGDIWDTADGFQFVYQPLHGNGQIIARVSSISDGDGWEKAGVMIREKATPDSRHALMAITRDQGAAFQHRSATAGASEHAPGANVRPSYWVRLQRAGNAFVGSVSEDGRSWTKVADATIEMRPDVLIGLAVTAHNNGALCNATFDNVAVNSSPSAR